VSEARNPFATSEPVWIVPARWAALLERSLPLRELRLQVRGRWQEFDEVLLAGHAVAAQYAEAHGRIAGSATSGTSVGQRTGGEQGEFRGHGTLRDRSTEGTQDLTPRVVAALAGCTERAVRKAADTRALVGSKDAGGRWRFDQVDVDTWIVSRKRGAS
jgi:hypothetical protein